jgi:hypothetical protein
MVFAISLQAGLIFPPFLTTVSWGDNGLVAIEAERRMYLDAFRRWEIARNCSRSISELLRASSERAFFHAALHSRYVHEKWFAAHARKRPDELPMEFSRLSGDNEVVIKGSITEEVILLKKIMAKYA